MDIAEIRRARLRALAKERGLSNLAAELGYKHPSFLSQMVGKNPSRDVQEKTARKFEETLGLPRGLLDTPLDESVKTETERQSAAPAAVPVSAPNIDLVADVIRLVGSVCASEDVNLPTPKFADVVAFAFSDMMEHGGVPREEKIKQIVRLLK